MPADLDPYSLIHDHFVDRWCVNCSAPPELYTFRGGHIAICSHCTADAIAACPDRLPYDLIPLEAAARRAVLAREHADRRATGVDLDTFLRCHQCDRLIARADARYPLVGVVQGIPPHCPSCHDLVRSGVIPLRVDEPARGPSVAPRAPNREATRLVKGRCERCGAVGDAFAWGEQLLIACPVCTLRQIEPLPPDAAYPLRQLVREMRKELELRARPDYEPPDAQTESVRCACGESELALSETADGYLHGRMRGRAPGCALCAL